MKLYRIDGTVIGEGQTIREIAEANKANLHKCNLEGADVTDCRGLPKPQPGVVLTLEEI